MTDKTKCEICGWIPRSGPRPRWDENSLRAHIDSQHPAVGWDSNHLAMSARVVQKILERIKRR